MPTEKQTRPPLITILTILLVVQTPILIFLALNLLTDRWSFLASWSAFWIELKTAAAIVLATPGEFVHDEVLVYDIIAFVILIISGVTSFLSGLTFTRGRAISWILSLMAQIGTLLSAVGLYIIHQSSQAYWLLLIGIIMVLYLNYGEVRQWFLQVDARAGEE
jgi:hypothetical protein